MKVSLRVSEQEVRSFPPRFVWGAATSAYQVEGAVDTDGRGESIWDVFTRQPGAIANGDTGREGTNHYHLLDQDLELMKAVGVKAYRFSISWPRVQPSGRGSANPKGLDFYGRLVDGLLEHDIIPFPTLYHWDLPQALQVDGGWPRVDTAARFAEYALLVAEALGDRVKHWITVNEPWCMAFLGHGSGVHAPGRTDDLEAVRAAHHLLLAHGRSVIALRSQVPSAEILIALNLFPVYPASDSEEDVAAARLIDGMQNRMFLDPILLGAYPPDVLQHFARMFDISFITEEHLREIAAPIDALGLNYYTTHHVRSDGRWTDPAPSTWPGAGHVRFTTAEPRTAMGWSIEPRGLTETLLRLHREYPPMPIYVTENGAAFDDYLDDSGRIVDIQRIGFLEGHLDAVRAAVNQGVDVRGYFVWSLLDNFEWAEGYSKRFGIVHVDFPTQKRTLKESALWYRVVIRRNGLGQPHQLHVDSGQDQRRRP